MRARSLWLAPALLLACAGAHAQQIAADRPGVGSDAEVVPQFTLQAEIGNDTREIRFGVLPGFELERDDDTWGAKLALVNHQGWQLSVRATRDDSGKVGFELPASVPLNSLFNVTTDVIWTREAQTYAFEFNVTPTSRLTITPVAYYDTKARAAIYAAWVPRGHDNLQLDIGYVQRRVLFGVSMAFAFARRHH